MHREIISTLYICIF